MNIMNVRLPCRNAGEKFLPIHCDFVRKCIYRCSACAFDRNVYGIWFCAASRLPSTMHNQFTCDSYTISTYNILLQYIAVSTVLAIFIPQIGGLKKQQLLLPLPWPLPWIQCYYIFIYLFFRLFYLFTGLRDMVCSCRCTPQYIIIILILL